MENTQKLKNYLLRIAYAVAGRSYVDQSIGSAYCERNNWDIDYGDGHE